MNHYTRQLGITGYEAPLPIVWAQGSGNPDLSSYPPPPPLDGLPSIQTPASGGYDAEDEAGEEDDVIPETVRPVMGFTPAPATRNNTVRARKKSRKAGMVLSSFPTIG